MEDAMLEYTITATQSDVTGGTATCARCPGAMLRLDTDPDGRTDAFNPAELLLTALAACMLKGIERVAPMLGFAYAGASVQVRGVRLDSPPKLLRIEYELFVETDEPDRRLELLHENVKKFGTIYNTLAGAVQVEGVVRRARHSELHSSEDSPVAALVNGTEVDDYC
jgi:uncharacterized OsmC-like protein